LDYEKLGPSEDIAHSPQIKAEPIHLKPQMCFEHVVQRGPDYYGNSYGSVSSEVVQAFKSSAYQAKAIKAFNNGNALPTHFSSTQGNP